MISTIAQGIIKLQTNTYTLQNLTTQAINLSPDFSITAYVGKKGLAASSDFLTNLLPVKGRVPTLVGCLLVQFLCCPSIQLSFNSTVILKSLRNIPSVHSSCADVSCSSFTLTYFYLISSLHCLYMHTKIVQINFFAHAFSSNTKYYQRPGNHFKK